MGIFRFAFFWRDETSYEHTIFNRNSIDGRERCAYAVWFGVTRLDLSFSFFPFIRIQFSNLVFFSRLLFASSSGWNFSFRWNAHTDVSGRREREINKFHNELLACLKYSMRNAAALKHHVVQEWNWKERIMNAWRWTFWSFPDDFDCMQKKKVKWNCFYVIWDSSEHVGQHQLSTREM